MNGFFNKDDIAGFADNLQATSNGKIREVDYLGSYPAPIDLLDYVNKG